MSILKISTASKKYSIKVSIWPLLVNEDLWKMDQYIFSYLWGNYTLPILSISWNSNRRFVNLPTIAQLPYENSIYHLTLKKFEAFAVFALQNPIRTRPPREWCLSDPVLDTVLGNEHNNPMNVSSTRVS